MSHRILGFALSSVLLASTLTACKKSDQPQPSPDPTATAAPAGTPASAPAPAAAAAAGNPDPGSQEHAYDKPALTEAKIQGYIQSAKDGHSMFEAAGAAAGALQGSGSIASAGSIVDQQEALAKKYGFTSFADYMDTAGRIMLAEASLGAAASMEQMRAMLVQTIASSEKQLADPALAAEMKASLTEALADTKKSLAEMDADAKSGDHLNAADLELFKKFKVDIEAAEKAGAVKTKK